MSEWYEKEKQRILSLPIEPADWTTSLVTDIALKRKHYACKNNYKTLESIPSVPDIGTNKISVWRGDITRLEVDAIVNAANEGLLGGGGIDEAIHKAAGPLLQRECALLDLCMTGDTKITKGYRLPAKFVLHTVGPYLNEKQEPQLDLLKSCYTTILKRCEEYDIRSVAICSISTGFYGHPKPLASQVAVDTVMDWLNSSPYAAKMDRIVFCLWTKADDTLYIEKLKENYAKNNKQL
jgi:O-acetyl-ADP-ribose deacetylase (regulator of RNase III)